MNVSGYISRGNLTPPLANLSIQVDPYWLLLGDNSDAADMSTGEGLDVALSALKTTWADSPYVAGKQLVLATPDNSTLDLRLVIDAASMADAQAKIAPIVTAIRDQLTFSVSLTFDTATYTWTCYSGDYRVAFNQLHWFGYLVPMYISLPRDPIAVAGPL